MQYDPVVMFECDAKHCNYTEEAIPDYVFSDYSGKNGYYDTDGAFENIGGSGWIDAGDDKHFCSKECEADYKLDKCETEYNTEDTK